MAVAVAFGHCAAPCGRGGSCSPDPKSRKMFGCDEDVPADPGYQMYCWVCYRKPVKNCPVCKGERKFHMTRCPSRCITPEVKAMSRAYSHYRDGFLPSSGSMLDQSHTFAEAVSLMGTLYGIHEDVEMQKAKARSK